MTKRLFRWWVPVAIIAACLWGGVYGALETMFRTFKISTGTMTPTLHGNETLPDGRRTIGDHIFVNKLIYLFKEPRRGDIVVFSTQDIQDPRVRSGKYYVKRIVGLPGESIAIHPPFVVANGKNVEEPEFFRQMAARTHGYKGYTLAPAASGKVFLASTNDEIVLGADEYLVLGDNSEFSLDGRYFGAIKKKALVGKESFIYFPFDRAGCVK